MSDKLGFFVVVDLRRIIAATTMKTLNPTALSYGFHDVFMSLNFKP